MIVHMKPILTGLVRWDVTELVPILRILPDRSVGWSKTLCGAVGDQKGCRSERTFHDSRILFESLLPLALWGPQDSKLFLAVS